MEGFLNISAVEVYFSARRLIVALVDYPKLTEGMRARFGDVIDVEARINLEDATVEVVKLVATIVVPTGRLRKDWERFLRRWKLEIFIQIGGVIAIVLALPQLIEESLVEVNQILPVLDVGQSNDLRMSIGNLSVLEVNNYPVAGLCRRQ
jgi:hypothetical protein